MARKSKRARKEAKLVWQGIRLVRDMKVAHNLANPQSELLAPNVVKYHKGRMDLGRAGEHGARARVSQLIIRHDPIQRQKGLERKYKLNDADVYDSKEIVHMSPVYVTVKDKNGLAVRDKSGNIQTELHTVRHDKENFRLETTGGSNHQPKIRTGTTPSRLVVIEKDGERVAFRTKKAPKFSTVGLRSSVPKDGGK